MLYKVSLSLRGPTATPLRGDTIWGHLCWAIRNHDGEASLEEFLELYREGELPLVFSDAFPHGFLPRPVLKPISGRKPKKADEDQKTSAALTDYKRDKSVKYVTDSVLQQPVSPARIQELLGSSELYDGEMLHATARMHNSIHRISGTVREGAGLYSRREWYLDERTPMIDLYVSSTLGEELTRRYVELAFADGYGADRSTGYGHVEVGVCSLVTWPSVGNRYLALAPFVPAASQQVSDIRGDIFTRFGKLGDLWAHHPNPFKRPVVMHDTGTTFATGINNPDQTLFEAVGSLLGNVHTDQRIKHLAASPVLPIQDEGYQQ